MTLLAIDTSSASTIIAVASDGGELLAARRHDPEGKERPQHTSLALVLAAEALAEAGSGWGELTRLGVGIGPGSFTGLRSGISALTALALRLELGVVGLRATELLAAGAAAEAGPVLAVIDGRRRELFVERFATVPAAPVGGAAASVIAVAAAGELAEAAGSLAIGDGALLAVDALRAAGAQVPAAGDSRHRITARALATLTAAGSPLPPAQLRVAYGREPDAVPTAEREVRR